MDMLFVTMDGGGNLPPTLGIAREVHRRSGTVRFLGHEKQRAAIEGAGFRFASYREGFDYDPAQPRSTFSGVRDLTRLFADRGIGRDALALLELEPADAVVVDCLLWGATLELADAGVPVVSLVHSLGGFFARNARGPIGFISRMRGANAVRALQVPALTLVATREDFEPDALDSGEHIGFVWQGTPVEADPAPDRPRVLVSFSTTSFRVRRGHCRRFWRPWTGSNSTWSSRSAPWIRRSCASRRACAPSAASTTASSCRRPRS